MKKIHDIRGSLYGQSGLIFDLFKTKKKIHEFRGSLYGQSGLIFDLFKTNKKDPRNSWISVGTIGLDF